MKTKAPRLTKTETRAKAACNYIASLNPGERFNFQMLWKRSATWGLCPSIAWQGEKAAHASGCGYDKESACLVEFLSFLAPEGKHLSGSGAGFSSVQRSLSEFGYTLEKTYGGKTEDGYTIARNA